MDLKKLVEDTHAAIARRRSAVETAYDKFVQSALAGRDIDVEKLATYCADNSIDPDALRLEVEIRQQRPALEKVVADLPAREAAIGAARAELAKAEAAAKERIVALQQVPPSAIRDQKILLANMENEADLTAPRAAVVKAELARSDVLHCQNRIQELERSVKLHRQELFGQAKEKWARSVQ